jgi:23S rRNA (cytosine1962-C5)-methyltransferase
MVGSYDAHPVIREHGVAYLVDVRNGQKTGFYLDQRANRALLARWANGRRVLDLYAHTGGFGLAALHAGARHVTFVESGSAAVDLLRENLSLNGIEAERWSVVRADVGEFLAAAPGSYGLVIMDPPPMARRKAHVVNALRGMAGQLADAFRCAEPGALLSLFSCSHHLAQPELDALIASIAATAGRRIRVLQGMSADADHPSSAEHPEGRYLVGSLMHIEGPE